MRTLHLGLLPVECHLGYLSNLLLHKEVFAILECFFNGCLLSLGVLSEPSEGNHSNPPGFILSFLPVAGTHLLNPPFSVNIPRQQPDDPSLEHLAVKRLHNLSVPHLSLVARSPLSEVPDNCSLRALVSQELSEGAPAFC